MFQIAGLADHGDVIFRRAVRMIARLSANGTPVAEPELTKELRERVHIKEYRFRFYPERS
jgi:hypothetical protein